MNRFARILVIDDELGRGLRERNRTREDFCLTIDLQDISGDVKVERIANPVAEAVFCGGQIIKDGNVENSIEVTLDAIRNGWESWPRWALLLLDLHFKTGPITSDGEPIGRAQDREPDQFFGLTILDRIWAEPSFREIPIVILTAMKEHRDFIEHRFAGHGARSFVDKNELDSQRLLSLLDQHGLIEDETIIGRSIPLLMALREARIRCHMENANILILGETGTGKELLPEYVHRKSSRAGRYEKIFTAGVPEALIEDMLFGHRRGAYTGAAELRRGLAELADRGTLFIDEFGNIPASIQSKLLRLLDRNQRETQRLGENEIRRLDLVIVMSTNRMDMLSSGDFHSDLLYRAGIRDPIYLPALRERQEDIPLLVELFVRKYEREFKAPQRIISTEALEILKNHDWPDNIRGLEGVIERAVLEAKDLKVLSPRHLHLGKTDEIRATFPQELMSLSIADESNFNIDQVISILSSPEVLQALSKVIQDPSRREHLRGGLPKIQAAYARLVATYLKSAIERSSNIADEDQQDDALIQPPIKFIYGDSSISGSKAADLVKKMLSIKPEAIGDLLEASPLREALQKARRLRPTRKSKARKVNKTE